LRGEIFGERREILLEFAEEFDRGESLSFRAHRESKAPMRGPFPRFLPKRCAAANREFPRSRSSLLRDAVWDQKKRGAFFIVSREVVKIRAPD